MHLTTTISKQRLTTNAFTVILAVATAVILPQVFHAVGILSGTGTAVGAALLPMHLSVLLAGMLGGPTVGLMAGILSPLVSFGISGMPAAAVLPFMVIELGIYGLTAGGLSKTKLPTFVQLLITQAAGRIARAAAMVFAIYALGNSQLTVASIGAFIVDGLFGILLQWALLPLLADRLKARSPFHA